MRFHFLPHKYSGSYNLRFTAHRWVAKYRN